ncbi:5-amino-6-(5-phospho-D-ribitylamino)uracil phosphatase YigB [Vibrio sp. LaRot3]|uniref:5-amino-6-(5-phospho-D-ribitylamino)uracil phosphatase YigB n=1 Tax=Vibrio sp. LaRot3 TaxID=2998829 RepID=UPI0022CE24AC|nr:5-amino-6-(5-phospho-D-ribitylamino)uracil phosphatase YigB [Vibrio sp. LaRot3]MDA0150330.1 5-amino-6-(5-phospho-D-ribitylamino)uracil phosphatase YigB [Vibrio sp. LaRot3]
MKFYRQRQPIKAMSFDLDDTLYDNRPVIKQLTREVTELFHQHHPISVTRSEQWWLDVKRETAQQDPWLLNDLALWRQRSTEQGLITLGYSPEQAKQAAADLMEVVLQLRSDFEVPKQTHTVMAQLASKMPLVAITNGNVDLQRIGIDGYFDVVLKSGRDGYAKPHADMFDKAASHLSLPPHQILHVGDHLITDVAGAKRNGFQACWFNDQGTDLLQHCHARTLPDVEIHQLDSLLLL